MIKKFESYNKYKLNSDTIDEDVERLKLIVEDSMLDTGCRTHVISHKRDWPKEVLDVRITLTHSRYESNISSVKIGDRHDFYHLAGSKKKYIPPIDIEVIKKEQTEFINFLESSSSLAHRLIAFGYKIGHYSVEKNHIVIMLIVDYED